MMHVTRNTIINWEADKSKPDYNLIPELCTLLNIQIHELFHMQAQTALSDAEANLKVTQDYYEAGLVALSDVLEAQTMLKKSRDELTDSRVEYRINLVTYRQLAKD